MATSGKLSEAQRRGRRNSQRGAELQREAVNLAKSMGLEAFNRDFRRGHHEKGDIEIEGLFYGCKRRMTVPAYLLPEKQESGVIWRPDGLNPLITIPLKEYLYLIMRIK